MSLLLEARNIVCGYDEEPVLDGLSFSIDKGSIACLLGPSGCGKTTALRVIAGFEPIAEGEILLRGVTASRPGYTLAPEKRRLGMVFQDYALFPHMTVTANICFGIRELSREARNQTASRLLQTVGLSGLGNRFPHELSGGQQQRVALARALAARPDLVLMDEPFSNLDVDLRERIGIEVREILKNEGITTILVTHDQNEAFVLGDMIGVMNRGRIVQWDTPFNLYHEPQQRFVADFIGQGVFLPGTLVAADAVETEIGIIQGQSNRRYPWPKGTAVDVLIRPDDIVHDDQGSNTGIVVKRAFKGASILYTLQLPSGAQVLALFPSHRDYAAGDSLRFHVAADHLIAFQRHPADTGTHEH